MTAYRPAERLVPRHHPDRSEPNLFDERVPDDSLEARFAEFHNDHPEVAAELVRLAREAKSAGVERIGIKALWERLRWSTLLGEVGGGYKLNNSFTALYARLIADEHPELASLFSMRRRRSEVAA